MSTSILVSQLKIGTLFMLNGVKQRCTHARMSRRYTGFRQIQYVKAEPDEAGTHLQVYQAHLKPTESVEVPS